MGEKPNHGQSKAGIWGMERAIANNDSGTFMSREDGEHFQQMANVMPAIFWIVSPDWKKVEYISPAVEKIYGYECEDFIGNPRLWFDVIHEEDDERIRDFYKREHGKESKIEYRIVRPDGTIRWIRNCAFPIRNEVGELVALTGLAEDITEEKVAEEDQQLFRHLIDQSNDAIFVIDPDTGKFLYVNAKASRNLGYTCEELLKMGVIDIEAIISDEFSWKEHLVSVRKNGAMILEGVHRRKDGQIFEVEVNVKIIEEGEKDYMLAVARNIDERKRSERALREREKELEQKTINLEEANAALRVLLKRRDEDKAELEEKVTTNIREMALPYLEKIKKSGLGKRQTIYVNILESNLNEVISPFTRQLSTRFMSLTPSEIQIANLVKQGKTSKQIAEILRLSRRTIDTHRDNIRRKLGLKNSKANLRTRLLTLE